MSKAWRIFLCGTVLCVNQFGLAEPSLTPMAPPPAEQPVPAPAVTIPEMTNLDEIAKALKVGEYKGRKFTRKIKVAVLDNGFSGYEAEVGKSLPKDTVFHNGKASAADSNETTSFHGLFMAKILAGLIAQSGAEADYELHLFNAFGYTKFADAVETVVRDQFDVVLYAQVWEYGGNGDGKGFINALVTKAVEAGVIWVNAAGNFGHLTRIAPVDGKVEGADEWVVFEKKARFTCKAPANEQCNLRLVLAWNDFKDDPETGSDKDLDLFVYDGKNNLVLSSERNQRLVPDPADKLSSIVPRELIESKIDSGTYSVKVKIKSKNFSAAQDKLRLTLSGPYLTLEDPSTGETLLPPADHPGVLVIGASDDMQTNVSKTLNKPDVNLKSIVKLKDGSNPFSTSNAAAMAAGVVVLQLGTGVEKSRDAVLAALKPLSQKIEAPVAEGMLPEPAREERRAERRERPADDGDSFDEERNCLRPLPTRQMYAEARRLLSRKGTALVRRRGRVFIAVRGPLSRYFDVSNLDDDQRLFMTPEGLRILGPEDWTGGLSNKIIEIIPTKTPVCDDGGEPSWMK